jgi:hypothetical protein
MAGSLFVTNFSPIRNRTLARPQQTAAKSRIAVLGAERSEGPLPALNVEMCMAQHLSLSALSCLS